MIEFIVERKGGVKAERILVSFFSLHALLDYIKDANEVTLKMRDKDKIMVIDNGD